MRDVGRTLALYAALRGHEVWFVKRWQLFDVVAGRLKFPDDASRCRALRRIFRPALQQDAAQYGGGPVGNVEDVWRFVEEVVRQVPTAQHETNVYLQRNTRLAGRTLGTMHLPSVDVF